jgi:hypothetical protein
MDSSDLQIQIDASDITSELNSVLLESRYGLDEMMDGMEDGMEDGEWARKQWE